MILGVNFDVLNLRKKLMVRKNKLRKEVFILIAYNNKIKINKIQNLYFMHKKIILCKYFKPQLRVFYLKYSEQ